MQRIEQANRTDADDVDAEPVVDLAAADEPAEETGISLELLDELRPYMTESLMVLDHDWTVKANLAPPGGLIGRGLGLGLHTLEDMHPDDALQVMDLGLQAFATASGWQGSKIVRMRRGDGVYGRYEITAINRFDDPVIGGMVVRTREVPQDMRDDLPGIQTGSAVEMLAELLPIGVLLLDPRGAVVFANVTACGMLDREPESLKRDGLEPLIAEADRHHLAEILRRITATTGRETCTLRLEQARVQRVECRFTSEGRDEVTGVVVTIEDVTARDAARRVLEERANHDQLTGLRNRASIYDVLQDRLDEGRHATVAYVDLDGFKAVNDTFGHARGDSLLIAVSKALLAGLKPEVDVARIGGDEFVIVADASYPGEPLKNHLRGLVAAVARAESLPISCSVGVSTSSDGDSPQDVFRRADEAMYEAKSLRG